MKRDTTSAPYVYCSGPLFSPEEQAGMQAIAAVCESHGWSTFLPQRDGLEPWIMRFGSIASRHDGLRLQRVGEIATFSLDVHYLLDVTNVVVCNLNGRVPDEGMIVEAALAAAAGRPVIFYKNDLRGPFGGRDNAMLTSLTRYRVQKLEQIPERIRQAMRSVLPMTGPLSPAIERARRLGAAVDALLSRLRRAAAGTTSDSVLEELITLVEQADQEQDIDVRG